MTTRAIVKFTRSGAIVAMIYKHCDGYPSGLGRDILTFLDLVKRSQSNFLDDPGCLASRFCAFILGHDPGEVLAVCMEPPGDEEYHYTVECKGAGYNRLPTVRCTAPGGGEEIPIPAPDAGPKEAP